MIFVVPLLCALFPRDYGVYAALYYIAAVSLGESGVGSLSLLELGEFCSRVAGFVRQ